MEITRRFVSSGGFQIYWYGVLIGLAVLAAVLAATKREKLLGIREDTALTLALVVVPFGIVGARLYYVLMHLNYYQSLADVLRLRDGGLGIYGGLILGAIAGGVAAKKRKQSYIRLCDLVFPCVALAQAIGRWGNFLNQEAYGIRITFKALQFFPVAVNIGGAWHAATFFYESLWCLMIYLVICVFPSKKWFVRRGEGLLGYMSLYAFERCAVEGLRTDSLYIGAARASQLLSAVILCVCCAYLLNRLRAKPLIWIFFAASALALMLASSALLPAWAVYASLPFVFSLSVYAWLKTRQEGTDE
ncbi:MAG: prolipoprotein diacylglyceryl transferase [Clostridia bacterium]|nr:prolipoprotein diacylglyceryl transferase [Clostridia bacterium]